LNFTSISLFRVTAGINSRCKFVAGLMNIAGLELPLIVQIIY